MPVVEKRTESGTGEAAGSWSVNLQPDTPKYILDVFDLADESARFATLVITPARVPVEAFSAATLRSLACYIGVLRARTSELSIGGVGVAALLGNEDGSGEIPTAAVAFSGTTLSTALDSYLPSNGITKGTVTNTGTNITDTLPGYISRRKLVQQIVDKCGGEWRITTDTSGNLDVDAAVNATLYGSTPPAMVIETSGGREPGIIGLEAVVIDQAHDIEDFATKQYVLARADGAVSVGSATSAAATSYFAGTAIKMEAVTDSSDTDSTNANTVATLLLGSRQTIKRHIAVSVNPYDIVGKTWGPSGTSTSSVRCGDSIYIYDPLHNLTDTANQVVYRGEVRFPLKTRVYGITWPVLDGMGVYLLTADSSPTIIDLSDWYVPELGAAVLDVGAQVRSVFSAGPVAPLSPYGDMPTALVSDALPAYSPQIDQGVTTNIAKSTRVATYTRIGRLVNCQVAVTTTGAGTAGSAILVSLPVTALAASTYPVGSGRVLDSSGGAATDYVGLAYLQSSTRVGVVIAGTSNYVGANPNFALANNDLVEITFMYEAAS